MKYCVMAEYDDAKVTVETNDVEILFLEAERNKGCNHLCICDGETGEVLMHTGDEPYCTDEFALMLLGWLMVQSWGEPEEPEVVCMPGFVPQLDELDTKPAELVALLQTIDEIKKNLPH